MAFVQDDRDDIFKEAIKQKILLFPLFKNKKLDKKGPLITGWQKLKRFDPDLMYEWREHFKDTIHSWAIQTDRWFLIDFDFGANFDQINYKKAFKEIRGNLKGIWFKGVKTKQKTKSGCHFFFKMPGNFTIEELEKAGEMVTNGEYLTGKFEALIRNRQGITGKHFGEHKGVDVKGINGYAEVKSVKLLKSLNNELIEAPYDLLQVLRFTHHFGPGSNNKTAFVRGIKTKTIKDLRETIKELFQNNEGRPNFDINTHLDNSLKVGLGKLVSKSNNNQEKEDHIPSKEWKMTKVEEIECKKVEVGFLSGIFVHHEFNLVFGETKIGKSRVIMSLIHEAIEGLWSENKVCGIISSDNDAETTLAPLIKEMEWQKSFVILKDTRIYQFQDNVLYKTRCDFFVERMRNIMKNTNAQIEALFFDPLPRVVEWNNEQEAHYLVQKIRDFAKEYKICVIGTRNEGKTKTMADHVKVKGSTALTDDSRQILRVMQCETGSVLHKKIVRKVEELGDKHEESKEATIGTLIYTERSSNFGRKARLFMLQIEDGMAKPIEIPLQNKNVEQLKYLATKKSGKGLKGRIDEMINNGKGKIKTADIYDELETMHSRVSIKTTLNRAENCFESVVIGGIKYTKHKVSKN